MNERCERLFLIIWKNHPLQVKFTAPVIQPIFLHSYLLISDP